MGKQETIVTIWEVPDELWERIEPIILEADPPKARGRKRANPRQMLNGIMFRLRSGCQWNRLPKEFGDDSTIHRTFQRWVELGVLRQIWRDLVEGCEELGGVDWECQAADGAMGKELKDWQMAWRPEYDLIVEDHSIEDGEFQGVLIVDEPID